MKMLFALGLSFVMTSICHGQISYQHGITSNTLVVDTNADVSLAKTNPSVPLVVQQNVVVPQRRILRYRKVCNGRTCRLVPVYAQSETTTVQETTSTTVSRSAGVYQQRRRILLPRRNRVYRRGVYRRW